MISTLILRCFNFLTPVIILCSCFAWTSVARGERVEGLTEPYQAIDLAASEPGVLTQINVQAGSRLRANDVVGRLDISVLEATLEIARQRAKSIGALLAAEAESDLRKTYLKQLREVYQRGSATQREIDRALADYRVAEARLRAAQEEQALQQLECQRIDAQIRRRHIVSPIDGVVSEVFREVGEALLANDPRVVTIVQLKQLRGRFPVEPGMASSLRPEQKVQVHFDSKELNTHGVVESVSPVIDAKSSTVEVTVVIQNESETIPSGTRCWLIISGSDDGKRTRLTSSGRSK